MNEQFATVYHISPAFNQSSIWLHGLLTKKARGKRKEIWLCERGLVVYILAHLSEQKGIGVNLLQVHPVTILKARLMRTKWIGVYHVTGDIQPDLLKPPISSETWLSGEFIQLERAE